SCECPHRLSDKLLKSVAAFLYENQPFGRCCEEAYITFSSVRVKQFFAFSFQNLSLPFQCSSRFALSCSRSVVAHYRESEKSGKCFFEKNFQVVIFYTLRPIIKQKK
ncbi:hypothetical protein J0A82_12335, partial [Providencia rettgeri]